MTLAARIFFPATIFFSLVSAAFAGIDEDAVKHLNGFNKAVASAIDAALPGAEAKAAAAERLSEKEKAASEIKALRSADASVERRYRRIVKIIDDYASGEIKFLRGKTEAALPDKKTGLEKSVSELKSLKAGILADLEKSFNASRKARSQGNPPVESVDTPRFDAPSDGQGRGIWER